jgi:hypothetical protein
MKNREEIARGRRHLAISSLDIVKRVYRVYNPRVINLLAINEEVDMLRRSWF